MAQTHRTRTAAGETAAAAPGRAKTPAPKRPLPTKVPPGASFRLSDCHRLLVREFGDAAPSLITLKRHAAAGDLQDYQVATPPKTHPKYLYADMRRRYGLSRRKALGPAPARPLGGGRVATAEDAAQIASAVQGALAPVFAEMAEQLQAVRNELKGLASIRQALMMKYDSSHEAALQRADRAEEQLRETRKLMDIDAQLRRLTQEVAKLGTLPGSR